MLQLKTPEGLEHVYLGIAIVRYTLGVAVLTFNGGFLSAFLIQRWRCRQRRPKRRLHPSGCFVINLLVADTLVGIVLLNSLQFKIWPENAVHLAKSHYACLLRFAAGFLAVCGSHNALLSVVIDRYIAIVHIMRYKELVTTRTCTLMITASWILPATGCVYLVFFGNWTPNMPTCSENTVIASFSLYVWLPVNIALLLSIVVIQICVHAEIWRYGRTKSVPSSVLRRSTHKSAKVMLISTLAYGLVYGPYDAAALWYVFYPSTSAKLTYDLCAIGTSATFLVNPCLYSFKTASVRRPVTDLLTDLRTFFAKKPRESDEPTTNGPRVENISTVFGSNRTWSTATLSTTLGVR